MAAVDARFGNLDEFVGLDVPLYSRKRYLEPATTANGGLVCSSVFTGRQFAAEYFRGIFIKYNEGFPGH
jgi:hypothetical protein